MVKHGLKKLLLVLLILTCGLSLCACHGNIAKEEFIVPDTFDTTQHYEITFWAKNDTNKVQIDAYNQAISEFESYYPNVTVKVKMYTDYNTIYQDVITNIATNTTPNVCIAYPDNVATYLSGQNVVVPLENLIIDEEFGLGGSQLAYSGVEANGIIDKYLVEGYIDGQLYTLPFMRSTEAVYINKDFVEALGYEIPDILTWDWIFEVSEAALEKNADGTYKLNGQKTLIPMIYKSTDNMMIQMLEQKGAAYATASGDIQIFNNTTKEILESIAPHAASKAFSTFKISSYPANFLNAGQCVFAIDSTAGSTWMGCDAPLLDIDKSQLKQFETVVRMVPQYDTTNPKMISQGPSICIFNKEDSGEVLASWLFAQYLLTTDIQLKYAETEGYVPVTKSAQFSKEYKDYLSRRGEDNDMYYSVKIDATQLLLDNIDNTFTTVVFNGSASLRTAAGELIESVTKSERRKETVDDAYFKKLFSDITSLYRLDQVGGSKTDLGALPSGAVALIVILVTVWVGIGCFYFIPKIKEQVKKKKKEA